HSVGKNRRQLTPIQTRETAVRILKIARSAVIRAGNRHLLSVVLATSVFRILPWPPSKLEHPDRHPSKERRNPDKPLLLSECHLEQRRRDPLRAEPGNRAD